jgi:hypothetical protein
MLYSFLCPNFNETLGLNPDVSYSAESGNTFNFFLKKGVFVVWEVENSYGEETLVREIELVLEESDHIVVSSITGLILIKLKKLGVKVSILNAELVEKLEKLEIKLDFIYSLISLEE